jgi:putative transposase
MHMAQLGRPIQPLVLTEEDRQQLLSITKSRSLPHSLVLRAQIVLFASEGLTNKQIATRLKLCRPTVGVWRKRYLEHGIEGLHDEFKSGRPRTVSDEAVALVVHKTLETKPKDGTHWSVRTMADATKISRTSVHRIWRTFGLQPHKQEHFTLSNDPFFIEKVRDVVGLYLSPPKNAIVLCVDEKSQIQALDRMQPMLPLGLGYAEGCTHDYIRHGTTTLFAALDIVKGEVTAECKEHHRHDEYLEFLNRLEANVPQKLDVHLIVDNYATHKHPEVKRWLMMHDRWHVHFTPTYSSWLNQVEIWFNLITRRAIRRGSFTSVKDLIEKINTYIKEYNKHPKPFIWTATADSIIEKIERLCQRISGTEH